MPNTRARYYEQWMPCQRCGFMFPMSQLTTQKGLLVCTLRCVDDLTIERHPQTVMRVLGQSLEQEGADLRMLDKVFFDTTPEEEGE